MAIDLPLRATGGFEDLMRLLSGPVEQAFDAAEAFLAGNVRDHEGGPIPAVQRVIPVAIIYDSVPLTIFTGERFESWMHATTGRTPFLETETRTAVQLIGIEDLEACETTLGLGANPEAILQALEARVANPGLRYNALRDFRPTDVVESGGPLQRLIADSKDFIYTSGRSFFSRTSGGAPT